MERGALRAAGRQVAHAHLCGPLRFGVCSVLRRSAYHVPRLGTAARVTVLLLQTSCPKLCPAHRCPQPRRTRPQFHPPARLAGPRRGRRCTPRRRSSARGTRGGRPVSGAWRAGGYRLSRPCSGKIRMSSDFRIDSRLISCSRFCGHPPSSGRTQSNSCDYTRLETRWSYLRRGNPEDSL